MINTGKDAIQTPPTSSATVTPTETPDDFITDEPTETTEPVDETPTPTPTPDAGQIKEHAVKSGESINSIARKYYGDTALVNKLCAYNNISDPNKIKIGQVIKIPPKEVLSAQ